MAVAIEVLGPIIDYRDEIGIRAQLGLDGCLWRPDGRVDNVRLNAAIDLLSNLPMLIRYSSPHAFLTRRCKAQIRNQADRDRQVHHG